MATTNTTNTGSSVDTSPVSGEPNNNGNTIYIHVDPSSFRAVVQQLTGARTINSPRHRPALSISSSLPPAKRPKLQERRRGMAPAMRMLDIPFATHLQIISQVQKPVITDISLSPVSTIDYTFFLASNSPVSNSPAPFAGIAGRPAVVLTKEEEEREEKAIAEKGFYLHYSPRGGEINGAKPKLLPLFPVLSPKAMSFSSGS